MEQIWTDPMDPAGFGGVSKLSKRVSASKKETQSWLSTQLAYSLNKPMRKRFPTRAYRTFGINDLWQMDLMEMIPYSKINNGYKYILTCIDVFSRFARCTGVKTKSANDIFDAMSIIFEETYPKNLQTDLGKEFYNSKVMTLLIKYNINHYTVHSQYKAALVERFNRTLRERLNKYFTHQGKKTWINVLHKIVHSYNHSEHRGLNGLRPVDISSDNETEIWLSRKIEKPKKPKYKINDFVRISKISASPFIKNFDQNWSDEVFKIIKIDVKQSPVMYLIADEENESVQGKFYEQELQVIAEKPNVYRIQQILKTKGKGKHKQYFVKWHGYSTPSWILETEII
jgi:hypothetical protein